MLNNLNYATISGGVFNDIGGNLVYNIVSTTESAVQDNISTKLRHARHAAYDTLSPARRQRHGCTPGTRTAILNQLMAWAMDSTSTKIYWLSGMAGTGKTTIAYSFSEILEKNHMLGTTFFCSRAHEDTKNPHLIFPTIACGLAQRFTSICPVLMDVLRRDPDAGHRVMTQQFNDLIVTPLKAASGELMTRAPVVIIIDALDECDNQSDVSDMLSIISCYSPNLPIKFFITGRPEPHLRRGFNRREFRPHSRFFLHDVEKEIITADIEIYARERLLDIADGRSDYGVSSDDWPPEDQLKTLVRLAGCLFIYAATACEYVAGGGNIRERLAVVTSISPKTWNGKTDALDALYDSILTEAYDVADEQERAVIRQVLSTVVCACSPLSINDLGMLLNMSGQKVRGSLSFLHSVIYIPLSEDPTLPISTFHASFTDYITDHARSRDKYLDPSESNRRLALQCLGLMQKHLRTNICRLVGQPPNATISSSTIRKFIPNGLSYACSYWASHITDTTVNEDTPAENDILETLLRFFDSKLLQWVECLSLLGCLSVAVTSLRRLEARVRAYSDLLNAVFDATCFITENFELLKTSCLDINSVQAWLPERSRIRQRYFAMQGSALKMVRRTRRTWGNCEFVLEGHDQLITSVSISPDGSRIASASMDKTVRIWNTATSEPERVLVGHSGTVNIILFSADGSHVVSGASDGRIHTWDVVTGELHSVLKSATLHWQSIIFSPDGNCLAVASANKVKVVHIWRTLTKKLGFVFTNPSYRNFTSIAYSPDGSRITAGSEDRALTIWNLRKGKLETSLKGHSCRVNMVAYSPDGSRIASAADDIRIWNSRTYHLEVLLKGYLGEVNSFAFSPDGTYITSAHTDMKIRIWASATGELKDVLQGVHRAEMSDVFFSRDGSRIISTSEDKRVSIWHFTATNTPRAMFAGYLDHANSIIITPDGSRLISSSEDHKVRIWHTEMEKTPEFDVVLLGHQGRVNHVAFSWDGSRLVSGSEDLRIWNTFTGQLESVLEESYGIHSVRFTPDGSRIVTNDYTWNPATGECVQRGQLFGSKNVASADGHRISSHRPPATAFSRSTERWEDYEPTSDENGKIHVISKDKRWIHLNQSNRCWLPAQYRNFTTMAAHDSKICLGFETGVLLLLDSNVIIQVGLKYQ